MAALLSLLPLSLLALLSGIVSATPKADVVEAHDILSLLPPGLSRTNATVNHKLAFEYTPSSEYLDKEHNAIVNLFKRGCTLPQGGQCSDGAACCSNQSVSGQGWCCNAGRYCANGKDGTYCTSSTVFNTVTATNVVTVTQGSTRRVSVAGSTVLVTATSTSIVTVTASNVDTATVIVTQTVTRAAVKRALPTAAPSTGPSPTPREGQHVIIAQATSVPGARFHVRELFARQAITSVVTVTAQTTTTRSGDVTVTDTYTATSTTLRVSTVTFTAAINAKTTVTSTFVLTVNPGTPTGATTGAAGPATTSATGTGTGNQSAQTGGGGGGGLSTGAKAGIGAGVGGAALVALIGGAFMLYRRRKNRQLKDVGATGRESMSGPAGPAVAGGMTGGMAGGMAGAGMATAHASRDHKPELQGSHYGGSPTPQQSPLPAYKYANEAPANNPASPRHDAYAGQHEMYAGPVPYQDQHIAQHQDRNSYSNAYQYQGSPQHQPAEMAASYSYPDPNIVPQGYSTPVGYHNPQEVAGYGVGQGQGGNVPEARR